MSIGDRSLYGFYGSQKLPKSDIYFKNDRGILYNADVLGKLKQFPDACVDLIVTSPPYWRLRDYSVNGQIGLEPTLPEYIYKMLEITKELYRILKPTGSMFWNHGDNYGGNNSRQSRGRCGLDRTVRQGVFKAQGIAAKSLALQNYRLLIRMIDEQGWILRNEIIWYKPNPVPSSAPDRFTVSHEPIYFLVKSNKVNLFINSETAEIRDKKPKDSDMLEGKDYHYEIYEPSENKFNIRVRDSQKKKFLEGASEKERQEYHKKKRIKVNHWKGYSYYFNMQNALEPYTAPLERWGGDKLVAKNKSDWDKGTGQSTYRDRSMRPNPNGRHPRDIWKIPTRPFPEAHFATFPEKLAYLPIHICCPANGVILDPFMGAGTVALVAQKSGCNWLGIELNREYCKIIKKRIDTKQIAINF